MRGEWHGRDVERLRTSVENGGPAAALAAFPERSKASVLCAIRRYVMHVNRGEPINIPQTVVRERFARIPLKQLAERLDELMERTANFGAVRV